MQIPILTILILLFVVVFTYRIKKTNNDQDALMEQFRENELKANSTRKQDISNLSYITIPSDLFPWDIHSDVENSLASLKNVKMLNLTGITNTELKLKYGVPNLEELTACDDAFTEFIRLLPLYARELCESGRPELAQAALEFGIENKADSKQVYTSLAKIYKASGNTDGIKKLIDSAQELDSLMKTPIINSLEYILNDNNPEDEMPDSL